MKERAIEVSNLKKYFKDVKAVDDISFSVEQGELFGFLGVNGAGKSRWFIRKIPLMSC